jgi:hypothetical protein
MQKIAERSIIFLLITSLVFIPFASSALAETKTDKGDTDAITMASDIVFARPLGLVATIVGSALFIVSLPFSALGDNVNEASQKLVVDPFNFTFKRPLGKF